MWVGSNEDARMGAVRMRARTPVAADQTTSNAYLQALEMGRAGFEPATLGLKVQPNEPQRTDHSRKRLQIKRFVAATN
jgi:hypothetical protein